MTKKKIILASKSPRRKELLENLGLEFEIDCPQADEESIDKNIPVSLYVKELAMLKAASAAKRALSERKKAYVIGADTVVYSGGKILGKPSDEKDAFAMLKTLSGTMHEVYSGICVIDTESGNTAAKSVKTEVFFRELTDEQIMRYIDTQEPMDKAGAYGIQGIGSLLVEKINGDYFNVVGLPVSELAQLMEKEFGCSII